MSIDYPHNRHNISSLEIKSKGNIKLRPLQKIKNNKLIKYNHISSYSNLKSKKEKEINISNNNLSVILFQENDVEMVKSLNPDLDKDICEDLLFKEKLKNNINNGENFDMPTQMLGLKINLPKIKKININGILEAQKKLNQKKKETLRNIANNHLEKELNGNLKIIRNEYNDIKNKKKELYNKFEFILKEINELSLELQIFENKYNDNYLNKILRNKNKHTENKFNRKSINSLNDKIQNYLEEFNIQKNEMEIDKNENIQNKNEINDIKQNPGNKDENKIKQIKMLYFAKKEQEEKKYEKYEKIKKYKDELKNIDKELIILNERLNELRKKENNIVQELMKHYEALLYKGRDTRNEGLTWIIKSIWNLGKNVPMQFIPTFLDFQSIEFLFKLANKSIELEKIKKLLKEEQKKLNIKLHKLYFFSRNNNENSIFTNQLTGGKKNNRSSLIFKTNIIKKNTVLKRSISQSNIVKTYIHSNFDDMEEEENNGKEVLTFKQLSKIIDKNNKNIQIEKLPELIDIKNLQKKINEIEVEIINLKKTEINRIFKEFIENDYQNKYHVSVDVVLAALLGEHNKNVEINKFAKFKREYFDEINNIRFFEFGKNKHSI